MGDVTLMSKWILQSYAMSYVYRPVRDTKRRKKVKVKLYYNTVYTLELYVHEFSTDSAVTIQNNMYILKEDGTVENIIGILPKLENKNNEVDGVETTLKLPNKEYDTVPNYKWEILNRVRTLQDDGVYLTRVTRQSRMKYWRYAGYTYSEDKNKRLIS